MRLGSLTFGIATGIVSLFWTKETDMTAPNELLNAALNLTPKEKAELIDKMLSSLDAPDKELDKLWSREVEERITAYERGEIKALTIKEVMEKYR